MTQPPPATNVPAQPNILERFSALLTRVSSFILLLMMLHVTADVVSKLLFNHPIEGTLEVVSYYYMVSVVFLPLALVEFGRNSVAVDALFNISPVALRTVMVLVVLLASAAIYAGLAAITWPDAMRALSRREVVMGPVPVPIWPARFILPASAALSALACLYLSAQFLFDPGKRTSLVEASKPDEAAIG